METKRQQEIVNSIGLICEKYALWRIPGIEKALSEMYALGAESELRSQEPPTPTTDEREEFEKLICSKSDWDAVNEIRIRKRWDGSYIDALTDFAWWAWQAARASRGEAQTKEK
jgi:hypothetical protein